MRASEQRTYARYRAWRRRFEGEPLWPRWRWVPPVLGLLSWVVALTPAPRAQRAHLLWFGLGLLVVSPAIVLALHPLVVALLRWRRTRTPN